MESAAIFSCVLVLLWFFSIEVRIAQNKEMSQSTNKLLNDLISELRSNKAVQLNSYYIEKIVRFVDNEHDFLTQKEYLRDQKNELILSLKEKINALESEKLAPAK